MHHVVIKHNNIFYRKYQLILITCHRDVLKLLPRQRVKIKLYLLNYFEILGYVGFRIMLNT